MKEKINNKNTKKFILKMISYIIFLWIAYDFFLLLPDILIAFFYYILPDSLTSNEDVEYIGIILLLCAPIIFSPIIYYVIAKIFGIFKYIDKLKNLITKFLALILVSFLSFLILFIKNIYNNIDLEISLYLSLTVVALIPAFLLYKFFQYLTKKHPTPFKKIGYYCSIVFYKDLFKKTLSNIKKRA